MLPVVATDGRSTAWRIVLYSLVLLPVSLLPSLLGITGRLYLVGAALLGIGLVGFGIRLATLRVPLSTGLSKQRARELLQATVVYLPLLFGLMMMNVR
jgi:protoheme IX farnesyltransferase